MVRYALACRDATNKARVINRNINHSGAWLVASRQAKAYRTLKRRRDGRTSQTSCTTNWHFRRQRTNRRNDGAWVLKRQAASSDCWSDRQCSRRRRRRRWNRGRSVLSRRWIIEVEII